MTIHEETLHYLENNPKYRERKYRGNLLANLAMRAAGIGNKWSQGEKLTVQELCDFAVKFDTYRHAWTDITKDVPSLQGSDYNDKESLMEAKQLELGYTPGHYKDVKTLKNL